MDQDPLTGSSLSRVPLPHTMLLIAHLKNNNIINISSLIISCLIKEVLSMYIVHVTLQVIVAKFENSN